MMTFSLMKGHPSESLQVSSPTITGSLKDNLTLSVSIPWPALRVVSFTCLSRVAPFEAWVLVQCRGSGGAQKSFWVFWVFGVFRPASLA